MTAPSPLLTHARLSLSLLLIIASIAHAQVPDQSIPTLPTVAVTQSRKASTPPSAKKPSTSSSAPTPSSTSPPAPTTPQRITRNHGSFPQTSPAKAHPFNSPKTKKPQPSKPQNSLPPSPSRTATSPSPHPTTSPSSAKETASPAPTTPSPSTAIPPSTS
jgi:hypothetical protein